MKSIIPIFTLPFLIGFGQAAQAQDTETAIFAGGCFWCVESDFEAVKGVKSAVSGFIGGSSETANYKRITKGGTGHYEAVEITFDPSVISYASLVDIFWRSIDATDAGGQFCDRGESYSSAIFATDETQYQIAANSKIELHQSGRLPGPVVTKIFNAKPFYPADEYHQDYYKQDSLIISRYGPITKKKAYKKYRKACGRDARVTQLWGKDAHVKLTH